MSDTRPVSFVNYSSTDPATLEMTHLFHNPVDNIPYIGDAINCILEPVLIVDIVLWILAVVRLMVHDANTGPIDSSCSGFPGKLERTEDCPRGHAMVPKHRSVLTRVVRKQSSYTFGGTIKSIGRARPKARDLASSLCFRYFCMKGDCESPPTNNTFCNTYKQISW